VARVGLTERLTAVTVCRVLRAVLLQLCRCGVPVAVQRLAAFHCVVMVGAAAAFAQPQNQTQLQPPSTQPAENQRMHTFMNNSGWCWYQDPRAIIVDGKVIVGGVEGNGDGAAAIGVFDLKEQKILGRTVIHPSFDKDDHNTPAFYARPDGRVLAVYARHSVDELHRYRVSTSDDFLEWTDEQQFKHDYPGAGNVTYMNLYPMSDEGKLYNYYRGIEFNPSYITSTDHGQTWAEPTHFIQNEVPGRQRPYGIYTGNGKDTVYVSFTDAHPRQFGNSIYYAEFRGGKFYKADGTPIKDIKDGALKPSEAELVFKGGGGPGRGGQLSAEQAAWTATMELDAQGHCHVGYTYYLSNDDNRLRLASWDGRKWTDREIAYGGKCLYQRESSYTGLLALDPVDPTHVVISTDVDPTTGEDLGGRHEVYRATVGSEDDITTIRWQRVTTNPDQRDIRPVILRDGDTRVTLWQRGRFDTYVDYNLDTVGLIETVE